MDTPPLAFSIPSPENRARDIVSLVTSNEDPDDPFLFRRLAKALEKSLEAKSSGKRDHNGMAVKESVTYTFETNFSSVFDDQVDQASIKLFLESGQAKLTRKFHRNSKRTQETRSYFQYIVAKEACRNAICDGVSVPAMRVTAGGTYLPSGEVQLHAIHVHSCTHMVVDVPAYECSDFVEQCRFKPKFDPYRLFVISKQGCVFVEDTTDLGSLAPYLSALYHMSNTKGFMAKIYDLTWWIGCKHCQQPLGKCDTYTSQCAASNRLGPVCADQLYKFYRRMGYSEQAAVAMTHGKNVGEIGIVWDNLNVAPTQEVAGIGLLPRSFVEKCGLFASLEDAFDDPSVIERSVISKLVEITGVSQEDVIKHVSRLATMSLIRRPARAPPVNYSNNKEIDHKVLDFLMFDDTSTVLMHRENA